MKQNQISNNPLVSAITIFLNAEQFIEEAIESAIAQTYDNWELLLIDDGSTDGSTAIAGRYARQYPEKIRYLKHNGHQNRGIRASRRLGIHRAQGKYVTFLDSDDIWMPDKLKQQVAIAQSHPEIALVCAPARWWYSWTGNPDDVSRDFVQQLDVPLNTLIQPPQLILLFLQDEWASLCDVLVKREVVAAIGGDKMSCRGMYEKPAFHSKLCLNFPAFVSSDCWYWYRQHPRAYTFSSPKLVKIHPAARQAFLNWLEEYLIQQRIQDDWDWKVLQQLFADRYLSLGQMPVTENLLYSIKRFVQQVVGKQNLFQKCCQEAYQIN